MTNQLTSHNPGAQLRGPYGDVQVYGRDDIFQSSLTGPRSTKAKPNMKNKPTFAALAKQVSKYLGGVGISASSVGDGFSFMGVKWNETDLPHLPAELWTQALLSSTPELLRVAGLEATADRLNLCHVPFSPTEARIVCALLDPSKPAEFDFASRLSAETDSPPNSSAAEESEPHPRPSRTPVVGQPAAAPRTVWTVNARVGDVPKPLESSAKSATDAQRVASLSRALSAHVENLQSDMPHATNAISPNSYASLQRLHVNLRPVLLDDLQNQRSCSMCGLTSRRRQTTTMQRTAARQRPSSRSSHTPSTARWQSSSGSSSSALVRPSTTAGCSTACSASCAKVKQQR